ncbi:hypothetical protein P170DRAFT_387047 [Aspergillus steynii IBT 23096]|uniref:Uncharacterized protein n=1 Tax=Aspergillus steynii IBT 23096 TaxID=1392250 RepID=A0A2I2G6N9_9EURO|nr:uncharacterized protein P170DRAFT_387047 [Aspergillus steynii IBT 23096]PLB48533.1 hypothetical protein P170DRAFT_387047 [Aspergillus steynii IBT 23096]
MLIHSTLALWIPFFATSLAETCYWPNGDPAPSNYVRCPDQKLCCATGEACLSNRLCYGAKYNIAYRGACVDKSWPEAYCPRACYDEIPDGWANLYACPNNTNQVFTCGRPGWAADVCKVNLGKYVWVEAQVSVARVSQPISTSTSTSTSMLVSSTMSRAESTSTGDPRSTPTAAASDGSIVGAWGAVAACLRGDRGLLCGYEKAFFRWSGVYRGCRT